MKEAERLDRGRERKEGRMEGRKGGREEKA